jgi:hypothetical protein
MSACIRDLPSSALRRAAAVAVCLMVARGPRRLNDSVCTGRPIAATHNGAGDAGAEHDLDAQAHTTVQAASGQGGGVPHNGAGTRWDGQSWMICTMDIANTAPIKAAPIRRYGALPGWSLTSLLLAWRDLDVRFTVGFR